MESAENYSYSYWQMEACKFFCCYGELSKSRVLLIIYLLFLPIIFKLPGKSSWWRRRKAVREGMYLKSLSHLANHLHPDVYFHKN
jgi:hypothetical protein